MFSSFTAEEHQRNSGYERCLSPNASVYTMCQATWQTRRLRKKSWKVCCLCFIYQKRFSSSSVVEDFKQRRAYVQAKSKMVPLLFISWTSVRCPGNRIPIMKTHTGLQHLVYTFSREIHSCLKGIWANQIQSYQLHSAETNKAHGLGQVVGGF